MSSELIPRATLQDMYIARVEAIELYRKGVQLLVQAREAHRRAAPGASSLHNLPDDIGRTISYGVKEASRIEADIVGAMEKNIDRDMWESLIPSTKIWSLMDKEERARFEDTLRTNPPPATPEFVMATVERLTRESGTIFRRGLVNGFQALSRDYKSNSGFRLGERIVMEYVVSTIGGFSFNYGSSAREKLRDVDRIMHVLDGRPAPEYQQGLCAAMEQSFHDYRETGLSEARTPYWRIRYFKNGNAHLYATRADLLVRANKMIAEHYGAALADDHARASKMDTPVPRHAPDLGDFPTPPELAVRVVQAADIQPGQKVLEPSAGRGNLATRAHLTGAGAVDCYEIQEQHVEALRGEERLRMVYRADFLEISPVPNYDRVVMNPPFAHGADIRHVRHAYRFLAPLGRLVSVMSAGVLTRQDALGEEFRAWVRSVGGKFEELPAGSFEESGTAVNTVLVTLTRGHR